MIFWLALAVLLIFAAVSFIGAPYVPTHKKAVLKALDMLPLNRGDLVVDLGSGDGVFLVAAAKKGFKAAGYEINPILFVVSWLRCLQFKGRASVRLANLWTVNLPDDTKAVFVFAAGPYLKRLSRKLSEVMKIRKLPLHVISYGFALPGFKPVESSAGLNLYMFAPPKR